MRCDSEASGGSGYYRDLKNNIEARIITYTRFFFFLGGGGGGGLGGPHSNL